MKSINVFESIIWRSRKFIYIAVVTGLIASLMMIIVGAITVLWDISHFMGIFSLNTTDTQFEHIQKILTINAVSAMDVFLIATVLYIFSIALYEIFVRKMKSISSADEASHDTSELVVKSLDELKEKLVKVILIVLVVTFFKSAISMEYKTVYDLLCFSLAVLVIAFAIFLSQKKR